MASGMNQELNYEEDLRIDPTALDVEWLGQANLFMRYAEESAHAERVLGQAHEKVKTTRSELILEIQHRGTVMINGEEVKVKNADMVEAAYRTDARHIEAKQEMAIAEYNVNQLRSAVSAFRMRKDALENLVRLHGQQYFAGPREPRDLPTEYGNYRKAVEQAQRERVKAKKTTRRKVGG